MKTLGIAWTSVTPLPIVALMVHICYCQKPNTKIAVGVAFYELHPFMNYVLLETDHLNFEIPFIFSIKISKNGKLPH